MATYIKPTFSLTANKNAATTNPGPLSIALSLNVSDTLSVDNVQSEIIVFTGEADHQTIFDGSLYNDTGTGGTHGGFVYMKNITASDLDVHVGIVADDGSASDLDQTGDVARLFTLKQGEFAFFPYDYTMDITADAEGAATLEYWLFDRA